MTIGHFLHADHSSDTAGTTLDNGRRYDRFTSLFFVGRRNHVFTRLADLSGARPGDRVLDVGCGTGYLTRRLAAATWPKGSALGIDPSPSILDHARRVAEAGNCSFATGVAESLEAEDESFDVVASSLMLHHLPHDLCGKAVAEMYRVLRPGGRLLIADFRPPTNPVISRAIGALLGQGMQHNPVHMLGTLVERTGFEQVTGGDLWPWIHYVQAVKPTASGQVDT